MVKHSLEQTMNMRTRKKYIKGMQFISAFLFGILISEIYGRYKCEKMSKDEIDENNYLLITLILTAPDHFERREAIRDTWLSMRPWQVNETVYQRDLIFVPKYNENGFIQHETVQQQQKQLEYYRKWLPTSKMSNIKEQNLKIKPMFAIGMKELDESVRKRIRAESNLYSDLLLLDDLKDSYKNLTLKLLTALDKINTVTPNFKYLLKSDDDSYVKLDYLSIDLLNYDRKLKRLNQNDISRRNIELYWGFFNGRASIKKSGQWKELNYEICDRYLPYALGGGYVISRNLVKYLSSQHDVLNRYESEDISLGTWLSPFRNIHRRHDPRFDTTYIPRKCQDYHIVLHKRTAQDMKEIHRGNLCHSEISYDQLKKPTEYFYDWTQLPSKCCDNKL